MDTHRKTAQIVGILYIVGTVAGMLSLALTAPVRSSQDYLVSVPANESQLVVGALFVLVMGLALAMVPVMLFPILRKHNEVLALGYVVFRGAIEAVTYIVSAISLLTLPALALAYAQAGAPAASNFQVLGPLLLEADGISAITTIVFSLGALMFYYVLFQSRLVPRWLSSWGLVAVVPYLSAALLAVFAVISPLSTILVALCLPMALQEMVLAAWLIVKGFNPAAIAAASAKTG